MLIREFLFNIFSGINGTGSYKRTTGFISLISSIVLAFLRYDFDIVSLFVCYSAAMGGAGLFETKSIKTNKTNNK